MLYVKSGDAKIPSFDGYEEWAIESNWQMKMNEACHPLSWVEST